MSFSNIPIAIKNAGYMDIELKVFQDASLIKVTYGPTIGASKSIS